MGRHVKMVDKKSKMKESVRAIRKPYPDREKRIEMVERKIALLEKLITDRQVLLEKTEQKITYRRAALEKRKAELENAILLKVRLVAEKDKPSRSAASRAEKATFDELKAKLEAQGKTLADLLKEIG